MPTAPTTDAKAGGLFVTSGMKITISPGGLIISMNPDGSLVGAITKLQVGLNLCPRWMAIAYSHLLTAEEAHNRLMTAFKAGDEQALGLALECEADAGMQAVFASCTAMDAYYGLLKQHTKIDAETLQQWSKNHTARYKRIAEIIRRTVPVDRKNFHTMRAMLKQGFALRDRIVHPNGELASPMAYDEIARVTEWRNVSYRFDNAKMVTGQFLNVIVATSMLAPRRPTEDLTDLLRGTRELCASTLTVWEERYGRLFPRPDSDGQARRNQQPPSSA